MFAIWFFYFFDEGEASPPPPTQKVQKIKVFSSHTLPNICGNAGGISRYAVPFRSLGLSWGSSQSIDLVTPIILIFYTMWF